MPKAISVVIPNYNGYHLLIETIPTIVTALQTALVDYEIIIADDCSTDGSVENLSAAFPFLRIITNQKNSGFSVTANAGIFAATKDLLLLLNSDVKLEPDYFRPQLKYFESATVFGVMGRIIGWNDDLIQDGAKYPSFHNAKIKTSINYLLQNKNDMKAGLYSMYLSGANALYDRKKLMQLGGFNELFSPFYVEDYELSLRAWRLGWTCYYEHFAICRHQISTTIKSANTKRYIRLISNRNKWFLHAIHLNPARRFLWLCQLVPEILLQTLFLKTYYVKAFLMFLSKQKEINNSRAQLSLQAGSRQLRSVNEVADAIRNSVKNKKLLFFQ